MRKKELRAALRELLLAADKVLENWCEGDLAGAVNSLQAAADEARELLE